MFHIRKPSTAPAPTPEQLADAIERLRVEAESLEARRRAATEDVRRLTEQAAAGTLAEPGRLADALRHARYLETAPDPLAQIPALEVQRERIQALALAQARAQAGEAYSAAVQAFASAYAQLLPLADRVRAAAGPAGVMLSNHSSPDLPAPGKRHVVIGGAVVDFPRGRA